MGKLNNYKFSKFVKVELVSFLIKLRSFASDDLKGPFKSSYSIINILSFLFLEPEGLSCELLSHLKNFLIFDLRIF